MSNTTASLGVVLSAVAGVNVGFGNYGVGVFVCGALLIICTVSICAAIRER